MAWVQQAQAWMATNGFSFAVRGLAFLLVLLAGRVLIGALKKALCTVLRRSQRVSPMLEKFVVDVSVKAMWVMLWLVALAQLGVDMAPMIAGLGVGGFIVGFAFQESLGNLAAGLMVLLNQPFKLGDFVEAAGYRGTVREMNLMSTTLASPDNKKIVLPNRTVWAAPITNFSALDTRRVDMVFGISYASDIGKAILLLERLVAEHPKVLPTPAPLIAVSELSASSVDLIVRPWVKGSDYGTVRFELTRAVKETFDLEGLVIPFPQLEVHQA